MDVKKISIISFSIIAGMLCLALFLFLNLIKEVENDGTTINISGRQRMLSQKITKLCMQIAYSQDSIANQKNITELKTTLDLFEKSHYALIEADKEFSFYINNSEKVQELFNELQTYFEKITISAKTFTSAQKSFANHLETILENEKGFLFLMNKIVFQYDQENSIKMRRLKTTIIILNVFILIVLFLEVKFILLPNVNKEKNSRIRLEESEQTFRKLFEASSDAILLIDSRGLFVECNQAALDLLKTSREKFLFTPPVKISPEYQPNGKRSEESAIEMIELAYKKGLHRFDWTCLNTSGEEFIVEVSLMPIIVKGQTMLHTTWRDITSRIRNEIELKKANHTKDKFFSIIAHDLKSPFSAMLGFSNELNANFDKYDRKEQKEFLSIIDKSIKSTYSLLNNLLLWARSQKGNIIFNPEKINLYLLINESIELSIHSAESKSIKILNNTSKDIFVKADKEMLSTILRNLFSNAIKFTYKGGEIIAKSEIIKDESNQEFAEIIIGDNGIGISDEMQQQLFDIGENKSTQGTEKEKGTGLGLILTKEFVEKHNGKIWVESKLGHGSSFIFTIPMFS